MHCSQPSAGLTLFLLQPLLHDVGLEEVVLRVELLFGHCVDASVGLCVGI